jgi:prepilin-type processing-associated H-X9-DG protein
MAEYTARANFTFADGSSRTVQVRELSVKEIRDWVKDATTSSEFDMVTEGLFTETSLKDFCLMTDLTQADLDNLKPSTIREVAKLCKEVNPDFFSLRERMVVTAKRITELTSSAEPTLPQP